MTDFKLCKNYYNRMLKEEIEFSNTKQILTELQSKVEEYLQEFSRINSDYSDGLRDKISELLNSEFLEDKDNTILIINLILEVYSLKKHVSYCKRMTVDRHQQNEFLYFNKLADEHKYDYFVNFENIIDYKHFFPCKFMILINSKNKNDIDNSFACFNLFNKKFLLLLNAKTTEKDLESLKSYMWSTDKIKKETHTVILLDIYKEHIDRLKIMEYLKIHEINFEYLKTISK